MDLSTEVLDHILASDFTLADHLALMGTCRALRRVYTCEVLLELLMLSNYGSNDIHLDPLIPSLASALASGTAHKASDTEGLGRMRDSVVIAVMRFTVSKTVAKRTWRVTDAELLTIPVVTHSRQQKYRVAAVRRLAYRSHHGPIGHKLHTMRLEAAAERSLQTRSAHHTHQATYAVRVGRPVQAVDPPDSDWPSS